MDPSLIEKIAAMLSSAGISTRSLRVGLCASGGNNRVYRVDAGGRSMLAKRYFRHPADKRDRLHAEYALLEYARQAGIDCVPGTIARDDRSGIALYEFIEGRKLRPEEIGQSHVDQALNFFLRLNDFRTRALAATLPGASEARFSIIDQLHLVQSRIDRLAGIQVASQVDEQAITLAADLRAGWTAVREQVLTECATQGLDPHAPLAAADRCISPSDFGFHNALVTPAGKIVFIDFEYAGWDDPAKAIGDFFSQPEIPVPQDRFDGFLASALTYSANAQQLARRTRLLLPVFRMKWCCIVMNDFLPVPQQRRRFADPALDQSTRKHGQLSKARRVLETIS
jgi:hypothetical protein